MKTKTFKTREDWLAARSKSIGASESAIIFGASKFGTPLELWSRKLGLAPAVEESEQMYWGNALEEPIARRFAKLTDRNVISIGENQGDYWIFYDEEVPQMSASPDRFQVPGESGIEEIAKLGNLQLKTTNAFLAGDWAEEIPLYYQIQVQHELACTGQTWGSIACLIGGQKLVWADYERNDPFIKTLRAKVKDFWSYIEAEIAPEVTADDAELLAHLYPEGESETIQLKPIAEDWDEELQAAKTEEAVIKKKIALLKNQFKAAMGTATFGLIKDGLKYSLKTTNKKEYIVKAQSYRTLRRTNK